LKNPANPFNRSEAELNAVNLVKIVVQTKGASGKFAQGEL